MRRSTSLYEADAGDNFAPPSGGLLGMLASPRPHLRAIQEELRALQPDALPGLLERLAYHRIDGLAHRVLASIPRAEISPWLRSALRRRYQRQASATLAQGLALAEILEALHHSGVPVIVTRGLRSAEWIYDDCGSRPFEDHDLLVRPEEIGAAHAVLHRQGFEAVTEGLFRRGGVLVDLHEDPLGARRRPTRQLVFPVSLASLFQDAVPGRVAGAPALLLREEDELVLIAIHLVKHSFDRLIRIADLAHLVGKRGRVLCWEAVRRRAESCRALRLVQLALESATLLGAPYPEALRGRPQGTLEAALMRRVMQLRPAPYTGEILMVMQARSFVAGARFFFDALLPAGERPAGALRQAAEIPRRAVVLIHQAARHVAQRRTG